jgi:hypothetical protein
MRRSSTLAIRSSLGGQYAELKRRFPHINVLGGCCGTNHRHVYCISTACRRAEIVPVLAPLLYHTSVPLLAVQACRRLASPSHEQASPLPSSTATLDEKLRTPDGDVQVSQGGSNALGS